MATSRIDASVGLLAEAAQHEYRFSLEYAHPDRLLFADEALGFGQAESMVWHRFGGGHDEAKLPYAKTETDGACESAARRFKGFFEHCVVHQFHDTSATSRLKVRWDAEESFRLLPHGGNLPSVLLYLSRHDKERFDAICYYVSRILPGFRRFEIEEAHGKTLLRWQASGSSKTIGPHLTSDGSLRFFALVTLLNLPAEVLPEIVLLDEPELGRHASAITLIAEMVKSVALKRQVVVATQSPIFVDFFRPHELVVLELDDGQTLSRDVATLYHSFDAVSTLVDFYGFRGKEDRTAAALEAALLERVRSMIRRSWDDRKVVPYVQKHEFEGLLFADVAAFAAVGANPATIAQLAAVRAAFPTPEDIDDHPTTTPSKRIAGAVSGYKKNADGPLVADRVGLAKIRAQCPRFDSWLTRLESL